MTAAPLTTNKVDRSPEWHQINNDRADESDHAEAKGRKDRDAVALFHAAVQNLHSLAVADLLCSLRGHVKRTDHCPDVTVLENPAFAPLGFLDDNFHHGPRQVIGPNHLVGEEHPKRGVDRA